MLTIPPEDLLVMLLITLAVAGIMLGVVLGIAVYLYLDWWKEMKL